MNDAFFLYDQLLASVSDSTPITEAVTGRLWACVRAGDRGGLAMAAPGVSIPPRFPEGLQSLPLQEAAQAVKSWNMEEASLAMAAINTALNTPERVEALECYLPFEKHYTDDLDFAGKIVGVIGHMRGSERMWREAAQIYTLERVPQPGDYPDSACEYLLPGCDIVLISGSTLINKTLPRLLALCENAYTVLTGPSVPLCPALLRCGIDRLAGLAIDQPEKASAHVADGRPGSPYLLGLPFVLSR